MPQTSVKMCKKKWQTCDKKRIKRWQTSVDKTQISEKKVTKNDKLVKKKSQTSGK